MAGPHDRGRCDAVVIFLFRRVWCGKQESRQHAAAVGGSTHQQLHQQLSSTSTHTSNIVVPTKWSVCVRGYSLVPAVRFLLCFFFRRSFVHSHAFFWAVRVVKHTKYTRFCLVHHPPPFPRFLPAIFCAIYLGLIQALRQTINSALPPVRT